jgi:hypothetical protein
MTLVECESMQSNQTSNQAHKQTEREELIVFSFHGLLYDCGYIYMSRLIVVARKAEAKADTGK